LTYIDDKCETGNPRLELESLSLVEKRMWKLTKNYAMDVAGFECVYYTIGAWDPSGFEGACSAGGYYIDLFDRANVVNVGFGNSTVPDEN
jgi:hypothetical protein